MSFSHIVWKMAKAHYKKYIFYYLCNSFTVMFFFIFSTVFFNEQIDQVKETESIQYILTIPTVSLLVFTIFFISYAHNIFIKQRRSEFALFMTLGMSSRDIVKLLLLENGMIALASIITGISSGIILSRVFFAALVNFIGIQGVPFHLNNDMFMYTIILFLIVFSTAVGRSTFLILKRNIILSLKSNKVAETAHIKSPVIGGMGLVFVVGSILGLYYTYATVGGDFLFLWISATLLGLYLCISEFTAFFIELAKRNKSYYYRRFLFLSHLDYKFRQLTSIFMLVTVMVMITILYSTITMLIYVLDEKEAINDNVYDIAIMQTENINNVSEDELYSIIEQNDNQILEHLSTSVYLYYPDETNDDFYNAYTFISLSNFNTLTTNNRKLKENEFIYFVNDGPEYMSSDDYAQKRVFPIPNEGEAYSYIEIIVDKKINYLTNLYEIIVVTDSQFEQLKSDLSGADASVDLINVSNWKKTDKIVDKLTNKLIMNSSVDNDMKGSSEELPFQIASKVEDSERNKSSNGISLFVTTILSILFFFGSFILLYSNLVSEIEKEQERFKRLHKIGITSKEIKSIISKDIATLFFVPTIVGTTLAFFYIVAMATDVGGIINNPEILLYFLIFAGSYHFIQIGFYLYAKGKIPLLIGK